MNGWQRDVLEFHEKFGVYTGNIPHVPPKETIELRRRLIREEVVELLEGIANDDLVKIADGLVDVVYVVVGCAIAYGIDMGPLWEIIQKSNMAKVGGTVRDDGKVLKPEGWLPPDVHGEILRQQATHPINSHLVLK